MCFALCVCVRFFIVTFRNAALHSCLLHLISLHREYSIFCLFLTLSFFVLVYALERASTSNQRDSIHFMASPLFSSYSNANIQNPCLILSSRSDFLVCCFHFLQLFDPVNSRNFSISQSRTLWNLDLIFKTGKFNRWIHSIRIQRCYYLCSCLCIRKSSVILDLNAFTENIYCTLTSAKWYIIKIPTRDSRRHSQTTWKSHLIIFNHTNWTSNWTFSAGDNATHEIWHGAPIIIELKMEHENAA